MHHSADVIRALLRHDAQRIRRRMARMDDKRFAALPRSADMLAEALPLPFQVAFKAKVIKARFADGDDPGMIGQRRQLRGLRLRQVLVVGMNADRSKQVGVGFRQCKHPGEVFQVDAYAEGVADIIIPHAGQQCVEVAGKIREIEMAVRINKHGWELANDAW
jgi:hypothetical protein